MNIENAPDIHWVTTILHFLYVFCRVLYFSVHRYEYGEFWPHLLESDYNYIGSGLGSGYNVNVPLNTTGCGDGDYLAIWHKLLLPIAYKVRYTKN